MLKLPMTFHSEATASASSETPWSIRSAEASSFCAVPLEFGGKGGAFSPEDLFLQAAINCFVGTFKVLAQFSKVSYGSLEVKGRLIVDKASEGKIRMTAVHLDISVTGAERPDRIETLVNKTLRDGYILNSITSDITHSLAIH